MQARFYQFAKRENSTKKPDTPANTLTIVLKEATDIINPVLEVHAAGAFNFNYCYIEFFGRYYWIRSAESIAHNTYLLHLECDVLASHIDAVRGQNVHALLSSYDYDIWLDDDRITTGSDVISEYSTRYTPSVFRPVSIDPQTGEARITLTECLGLITENGQLNGIDILYGEVGSNNEIMQEFADPSFWDNIKSGSPWDCVCESYFIPYNVPVCHITESHHYTHAWAIDINDKDIIKRPFPTRFNTSIVVPLPSNLDFRFSEKYVRYYLNIPYSGMITLPTALIYAEYAQHGQATVYITYSADCITGQFAVAVKVGKVPIGIYGANLKIPLPLGGRQTQQSVIQTSAGLGAGAAATAAMAAGAGLFSKAALIAAGVGAIAGAVKGAIDIPPVNSFGTFGGAGALAALREADGDLYIVKVEADSNIDPATLTAIAGRPCNKVISIANGFIQALGASVSFAGTSDEIRQFNNLLNGGIYVE